MEKIDVLRAADLLAGVGDEFGVCEYDEDTHNAMVFIITSPNPLEWSDGTGWSYQAELKGSLLKQFKVDSHAVPKSAIDVKYKDAGQGWYFLRTELRGPFSLDSGAVVYQEEAGAIAAERDRQWAGLVASTDYFNNSMVEGGPGWFSVGAGSKIRIEILERYDVPGAEVVPSVNQSLPGFFVVGAVLGIRRAEYYDHCKIEYVPADLVSASGKKINFKSLETFEKWKECLIKRREMEIEGFEKKAANKKNGFIDSKLARLFDYLAQFVERNPKIKIGVERRRNYWESRRVPIVEP